MEFLKSIWQALTTPKPQPAPAIAAAPGFPVAAIGELARAPVATAGIPAAPAYVLQPAILLALWPSCPNPVGHAEGISRAWERWGVTTPAGRAAWLAQAGHETGEGKRLAENMNYLDPANIFRVHRARGCRTDIAKQLASAWADGMPIPPICLAECAELVGNPQKMANRVYDGILGNRPGTGDGYTFRGAGGTQTTGRQAFARLAQVMGQPSAEAAALWAATPAGAWHAMGLYWQDRGCTAPANAGDFVRVVLLTAGKMKYANPALPLGMPDSISRLIKYEADRLPRYRKACQALGAT